MAQSKPVTIIYHADCLDGFGAAYAAWCRFGNATNYYPAHHGESLVTARIADHQVYILDFSLPPPKLEAMAADANSVTQIDHHMSALEAWADKLRTGENSQAIHRHPALPLTVISTLKSRALDSLGNTFSRKSHLL